MKRLVTTLALIAGLLPWAASAQQSNYSSYRSNYRFEFTPTASYRFGGTLYAGESSLFTNDVKVKDSSAYGLTFDIPLASNIQLELLANRQSSTLRFDQGLFGGTSNVADIDVSYYHVGVLWQWGDGPVVPFVVASLGDTNLNPDVPGASSNDRFSASLGGGVKVFFNDNIGLRFEGRGFWTDVGGSNNNRHRRDSCYYNDNYCYGNNFSQGQASIGLIFAWQ